MTSAPLKLSAGGRRGLIELGRAAHKMLRGRRAVEVPAMGVVDAADEVLVLVVTHQGALLRSSKIRGRALDARELRWQLAGVEAAIDEMARALPAAAGPQLSSAEAAMLDEAGLAEGTMGVPNPLERSRIELDLLVRSSLTIEDAARALGVSTSRIRQRLSPKHPTLYGIKEGRGWRIPRFQFESKADAGRRVDGHPLGPEAEGSPVVPGHLRRLPPYRRAVVRVIDVREPGVARAVRARPGGRSGGTAVPSCAVGPRARVPAERRGDDAGVSTGVKQVRSRQRACPRSPGRRDRRAPLRRASRGRHGRNRWPAATSA